MATSLRNCNVLECITFILKLCHAFDNRKLPSQCGPTCQAGAYPGFCA